MKCIPCISRWLMVGLSVFSLCVVPVASAKPPEGKGKPSKSQGQGQGNPGKGHGKGDNSNKDKGGNKGNKDYGNDAGDLITAGITFAAARNLALGDRYVGYSALPPGIRKNLARGKPLPPGIAKKMVPHDMLGRLPYHPGYEWRMAGSDLILVAIATGIVADVLMDVFK